MSDLYPSPRDSLLSVLPWASGFSHCGPLPRPHLRSHQVSCCCLNVTDSPEAQLFSSWWCCWDPLWNFQEVEPDKGSRSLGAGLEILQQGLTSAHCFLSVYAMPLLLPPDLCLRVSIAEMNRMAKSTLGRGKALFQFICPDQSPSWREIRAGIPGRN